MTHASSARPFATSGFAFLPCESCDSAQLASNIFIRSSCTFLYIHFFVQHGSLHVSPGYSPALCNCRLQPCTLREGSSNAPARQGLGGLCISCIAGKSQLGVSGTGSACSRQLTPHALCVQGRTVDPACEIHCIHGTAVLLSNRVCFSSCTRHPSDCCALSMLHPCLAAVQPCHGCPPASQYVGYNG
jgi:hypothetical protein